jgi:O-antigen/teichoic acid export membrane protein
MEKGQYGQYLYVVAWMNIAAMIGVIGLNNANVRFLSDYVAKGNWGKARGLFRRSIQTVFALSILLAVAIAAVVWFVVPIEQRSLAVTWWIACLALPMMAATAVISGSLRGLKLILWSKFTEVIVRPLAVVTPVALLFYYDRNITPALAMTFFMTGTVLSALLGIVVWRRNTPSEIRTAPVEYETKGWLKTSAPLLLVSATFYLINQTDTLMIGAFLGLEHTEGYSTASRIAALVAFGMMGIQSIAGPLISEAYWSKRRHRLDRILNMTACVSVLFAIPTALILMFFGSALLSVFRADFTSASTSLTILCAAQLFNTITGATGLMMTMTGREKTIAIVIALGVLLNIVLNYILLPLYGITGAAIATCVASITWNAIIVVYVYRKMEYFTLPRPWLFLAK